MLKPIMKWAGGKRQLLSEIIPLIEGLMPRGATYVEPFVGGGAVLFELRPTKALINDLNGELINVYKTVRDEPEALIERLTEHARRHSKEYFYEIREWDRSEKFYERSAVDRAARTIYLNKTCFNGLYRVNAAGHFNVPFGRYNNPSIVDEQSLRAVGEYLRQNDVTICNGDYRALFDRLDGNFFVYFDPPYQPLSRSSNFTSYTQAGFDYNRQVELRDLCCRLRAEEIFFVESNSDCAEVRELYADFEMRTVRATRAINSAAGRRGAINEVLIYYGRRD